MKQHRRPRAGGGSVPLIIKQLPILAAIALVVSTHAYADAPKLDPQACKNLSAAYQPGVDVRGKPVVPADIAPPVVAMPEKFSFDVNIDVAKQVGLPVPPGTEMQARVGTVTYDKGVLTFNGKPLDSGTEANIRALCVDKKPDPAPAAKKAKDKKN
jgi:hypothetical protein